MPEDGEDIKDIYGEWFRLSNNISRRFQKIAEEGTVGYEEFLGLWSEYSNTMSEEMKRCLTDEEKTKDLANTWKEYTKSMEKHIYSCMEGQTDVYALWMDAFGTWANKGDGEGDNGPTSQYPDPMSFWTQYLKGAEMKMPGVPNMGPDELFTKMQEMQDEWSKQYSSAVKDFMRTPAFASWAGNMVNQTMDSKEQLNSMTTEYLQFLGLPTQSDLDSIRLRFHEMDKKLTELCNMKEERQSPEKS